MLLPDVNLLVYAHREDERVHEPYRRWLEELVQASQPFALSSLVACAFVRIVTNRRIYPAPTPLPVALAVIDALVARPSCQLVSPGPRHWELVATLCRQANSHGAHVADAQHAAVAVEHGCEFVTRDEEFAKFEAAGLRWRHLVLGG